MSLGGRWWWWRYIYLHSFFCKERISRNIMNIINVPFNIWPTAMGYLWQLCVIFCVLWKWLDSKKGQHFLLNKDRSGYRKFSQFIPGKFSNLIRSKRTNTKCIWDKSIVDTGFTQTNWICLKSLMVSTYI